MVYLFYKVNKAHLYLIKFLLESYENMMSLSTIDNDAPKIQITVAPDFIDDALAIIADMQKRFFMQKLDGDPASSQGNY